MEIGRVGARQKCRGKIRKMARKLLSPKIIDNTGNHQRCLMMMSGRRVSGTAAVGWIGHSMHDAFPTRGAPLIKSGSLHSHWLSHRAWNARCALSGVFERCRNESAEGLICHSPEPPSVSERPGPQRNQVRHRQGCLRSRLRNRR